MEFSVIFHSKSYVIARSREFYDKDIFFFMGLCNHFSVANINWSLFVDGDLCFVLLRVIEDWQISTSLMTWHSFPELLLARFRISLASSYWFVCFLRFLCVCFMSVVYAKHPPPSPDINLVTRRERLWMRKIDLGWKEKPFFILFLDVPSGNKFG